MVRQDGSHLHTHVEANSQLEEVCNATGAPGPVLWRLHLSVQPLVQIVFIGINAAPVFSLNGLFHIGVEVEVWDLALNGLLGYCFDSHELFQLRGSHVHLFLFEVDV